ncbi:hypothetical protein PHAVU_008G285500 [Phaseolus vulgaris]|uniref:Pentacotripeptide-repeat region of PRORP domain-containing protein n=1 Tax=Phaseolus vulgaris TaxID=3885 RepID=V7BA73_PHAVU|nr:hypothetical protein PHAVU_008G285500g [Phaseolus vulgaris]XP_007142497.1 hypothetical protein PHAVU_008G285500g [Phaseolus vulgaris]ESW14490.1 hypothetical protein PHAVU_008G285500g [Phaseolus vulgaris]ESW14491.1 hypothetical protein PHAVU_008G285500g [Phaseolus vulgaris]
MNLTWSCGISSVTPLTSATNNALPKRRRRFHVVSLKRKAKAGSAGLVREPKKELSRILRTEAAIKGVQNKAKSNSHKQLWPKALLEALDDAIKRCRWQSALEIFALLRKQNWYEPRCQTYAKLLMMLGKCKQPEEASHLFEIMFSEGLKPTVDVYTALVSAYGQSGLLDQAFSTVEDMKSVVDCEPDIYTYSILAGMFEKMDSTLNDMIENGNCHPDVFTLNSFVGAHGKDGQIDKMEKWYDEFQLMGIKPDITTFNLMIKSYGKAGMYKKMKTVIDFMERRVFSPTIVTYNTVIEVFGKAGEIEKMDQHFLKMKHLGVKPNSITYCSLVSAYSKAGRIDKVESIMRHVDNSDVVLDTPFFNCIISAYGQAGDLKKMCELFMAMRERKCEPDNITFASMILAYNTQGMTEAAQKLENMMISAKNNLDIKLIEC